MAIDCGFELGVVSRYPIVYLLVKGCEIVGVGESLPRIRVLGGQGNEIDWQVWCAPRGNLKE